MKKLYILKPSFIGCTQINKYIDNELVSYWVVDNEYLNETIERLREDGYIEGYTYQNKLDVVCKIDKLKEQLAFLQNQLKEIENNLVE